MSVTLTSFMNDIYAALPTFNREMTGFLGAVPIDAKVSMASKDETVKVPIAKVSDPVDYAPSMTVPTPADDVLDEVEVKMTEAKMVSFKVDGESSAGLQHSGNLENVNKQRFQSGFRQLANYMDTFIASKAVAGASRAYGTAGTTPFATAGNLTDIAGINQILNDNGCPTTDRQLVLSSPALFNFQGKMSNLFKVNEYGSKEFLDMGYLDRPLQGLKLWSSAGLMSHTAGTGTGYLLSAAAAKGSKSISVDTGSGTVLAGDVVTIAGDTNKYIVNTGITAAGTLAVGNPGLIAAGADDAALSIGSAYTPNVAFHKNAIAFGTRIPYMPQGGDGADDRMVLVDPVTGIAFDIRIYGGFGQNMVTMSVVYGAKVVMPENVAVLLG